MDAAKVENNVGKKEPRPEEKDDLVEAVNEVIQDGKKLDQPLAFRNILGERSHAQLKIAADYIKRLQKGEAFSYDEVFELSGVLHAIEGMAWISVNVEKIKPVLIQMPANFVVKDNKKGKAGKQSEAVKSKPAKSVEFEEWNETQWETGPIEDDDIAKKQWISLVFSNTQLKQLLTPHQIKWIAYDCKNKDAVMEWLGRTDFNNYEYWPWKENMADNLPKSLLKSKKQRQDDVPRAKAAPVKHITQADSDEEFDNPPPMATNRQDKREDRDDRRDRRDDRRDDDRRDDLRDNRRSRGAQRGGGRGGRPQREPRREWGEDSIDDITEDVVKHKRVMEPVTTREQQRVFEENIKQQSRNEQLRHKQVDR